MSDMATKASGFRTRSGFQGPAQRTSHRAFRNRVCCKPVHASPRHSDLRWLDGYDICEIDCFWLCLPATVSWDTMINVPRSTVTGGSDG